MALVRGFGSPLYMLVLPSAVSSGTAGEPSSSPSSSSSSFIILFVLLLLLLLLQVLVEMEEATDAQKLLDHFSSDSLKINGEAVTVTFSREFRSLM